MRSSSNRRVTGRGFAARLALAAVASVLEPVDDVPEENR